jgi:hypothetical protein
MICQYCGTGFDAENVGFDRRTCDECFNEGIISGRYD